MSHILPIQLLERVIQMEAPSIRRAWAWRDMGKIFEWLKRPKHDILEAYQHAIALLPDENRFTIELKKWVDKNRE